MDLYSGLWSMKGLPPLPNAMAIRSRALFGIKKYWRENFARIAGEHRPSEPLKKVRIVCTRFSFTRPDDDNLGSSFKPIIDALKIAGIIIDDKPSVVRERIYLWKKAPQKEGWIQVVVEEL